MYSKRSKVTYNSEIGIAQGRWLEVLSATWRGGWGGGGRNDINSSPLGYPIHVKTTIIRNENFV
jgi:hypothetical protein